MHWQRAQKERIKEYSRNLRAQNAHATDLSKHHAARAGAVQEELAVREPTKREKVNLQHNLLCTQMITGVCVLGQMAKYASQVPKPRVAKKKIVETIEDGYEGYGKGKDDPLTVLEQFEAKHRQDQIAVAAIRKEMGMSR